MSETTGITLRGLSTRPRTVAGLDPARPDRFVLRTALRWVPTAALLAMLLAGAWFFGDIVPPLVLALPAGAAGILFGLRRWTILDRGAGTLRQGWGLLFPWRLSAAPIADVRAVTLERVERVLPRGKGGARYVTQYWAGLFDGKAVRRLAVTSEWEDAVPITEAMARFLRLPVDDRTQDSIRRLEDLDRGLGEAAAGEPAPAPAPTGSERYQVEEEADGALHVRIPQPRKYHYLLACVLIFLAWTLPCWSHDALPVGLVPLAVVLVIGIKMAFGFRADLVLSASGLEVRTFGLLYRRRVVFPLSELEELALLGTEQGGLRGLQTGVFAGVLVARSDKASVRFGHGLSQPDLESLRILLRARVVELHRRIVPGAALPWPIPAQSADDTRRIPPIYRPLLPFLGLLLGAAAGHFAAGRLGACLACPFVEQVLNVGGLLGAAAALWFDRRPWQRFWGPVMWPALFTALLAAGAMGLLQPDRSPFQPTAGFNEAAWLAGTSPPITGLVPVAWMLAVLVAAPLALALLGVPVRLLVPEGHLVPPAAEPEAISPGIVRHKFAQVALVAGLGMALAIGVGLWQRHVFLSSLHAPAEALPGSATGPGPVGAAPDGELFREPAPGLLSLPAEATLVGSETGSPAESGRQIVRVPVEEAETEADFTVYRFGEGLENSQFMPVAVDGSDVWVGTGRGLLHYRPGDDSAELYSTQAGLPGERVTALAAGGGRVALDLSRMNGPHSCTGLGVFLFNSRRLSWQRVLGGAWDLFWEGSTLWAARGGEVSAREAPAGTVRRYSAGREGPAHNSVSCLAVSPTEVWCGMFGDYVQDTQEFSGGGISRLDRRTGRWTHYTTADGLARDYTCALAADDRAVWAAHWDEERGLSRYDRTTGRWSAVLRSADGVEIGGTRLALDESVLWVGQQGGLIRLDCTSLRATVYREADGLPGYIIGGIAVAPDAVWVTAYAYNGQDGIRSAGLARFPRAAAR